MSDELKQFYREIWAWIQDGCPGHKVFSEDVGLCTTLMRWGDSHYLLDEQQSLLVKEYGPAKCPFNGNLAYYIDETDNLETYQNPRRLAFIKEHAK